MTLTERAAHYHRTFPSRPPLHVSAGDGREWLEGTWIIGNDYTGTGYYGEYPHGYLDRVAALFPDQRGRPTLHAFSGSLTADAAVRGVRVDRVAAVTPDLIADVQRLPLPDAAFTYVLADPPYSAVHATRYGTPMPSRAACFRELARVTAPGGWLVWLDTKHPMFRKDQWHWAGTILLVRSTNHDLRGVAFFQRLREQFTLLP